MAKRKKQTPGFTLIEIVVVIGVLGIIAIFGASLFFTILRGSAKTRILSEVKQNGNFAIGVMGKMIRNAKKVEGVEDYTGDSVTIVNPDNGVTVFSCENIGDEPKLASNGASLVTQDKVQVDDCTGVFSVAFGEAGINPDKVTIDFVLLQSGTTTRVEEQARINFRTKVTLRNY